VVAREVGAAASETRVAAGESDVAGVAIGEPGVASGDADMAGAATVAEEVDNGLNEGQGRGALHVNLNTARAARWSYAGAGHRGNEVGRLGFRKRR